MGEWQTEGTHWDEGWVRAQKRELIQYEPVKPHIGTFQWTVLGILEMKLNNSTDMDKTKKNIWPTYYCPFPLCGGGLSDLDKQRQGQNSRCQTQISSASNELTSFTLSLMQRRSYKGVLVQ